VSSKEIDEVYEDRNALAVYFVKSKIREDPSAGGWVPDEEEPQDWAIVWFETSMGEVSWHVPRRLAEKHLPRNDDRDYDGYGRDVKNDRLWLLVDELSDRGVDL
jgi:hypothetical protein